MVGERKPKKKFNNSIRRSLLSLLSLFIGAERIVILHQRKCCSALHILQHANILRNGVLFIFAQGRRALLWKENCNWLIHHQFIPSISNNLNDRHQCINVYFRYCVRPYRPVLCLLLYQFI